ncbi:MAG: nucleotidyltransferase domain-containing protein, partial [Propionibacteriaceae bacterium]|nr:nucleotidyltransferase domain-containing protein [Propionibacteriaceae bacterium]
LYRLNRDHALTPVVLAAVRVRAEVNNRLAEESGNLAPKPLSVAIFGSVARGDATADSDLDLLIIATDELDPESDAWTGQVDDLEQRTRLWIGNPLQTTTVTKTQLAAMASSGAQIVDEWDRDVCTIMGQDARGLIRSAQKKVL